MKTKMITAAAILVGLASGASAADLKAASGHTIHLGAVNGSAYYTVEDGGLRLVATVAGGETAAPVRFISTLADGQAMTISVPASGGVEELTFRRIGDRLVVEDDQDLRASLAQ